MLYVILRAVILYLLGCLLIVLAMSLVAGAMFLIDKYISMDAAMYFLWGILALWTYGCFKAHRPNDYPGERFY